MSKQQTEAIFKIVRPKQWAKNMFVFAGLVFANKLGDPGSVLITCFAFVVFCAAASAGYIFNDILDREQDRLHPTKKNRPIAAGKISIIFAVTLMLFLLLFAITTAFMMRAKFGLIILAFILFSYLYTLLLKHIVIIDIMAIAALFVMRAVGGAEAIDVPISPWLLICTTLVALFFILGKRYHEITAYGDDALEYRKVIKDYSASFIREMLTINAAATMISYSLYSFFSQTANGKSEMLMLTIPLVVYGLFRYLYLIYEKGQGGSPEEILFSDVPTIINFALWVVSSGLILYYF